VRNLLVFLRVSVEVSYKTCLYLNEREGKETKKVMKVCYLHNREVWPKFRSLIEEI